MTTRQPTHVLLDIGQIETVRFTDPDLRDHLLARLSQGSRVELLNRGQAGFGPERLESLALSGSTLVYRPANPEEGGWTISEKTFDEWIAQWMSLVKNHDGSFKYGPRGGLSFYLSLRRTERSPVMGCRR